MSEWLNLDTGSAKREIGGRRTKPNSDDHWKLNIWCNEEVNRLETFTHIYFKRSICKLVNDFVFSTCLSRPGNVVINRSYLFLAYRS